MSTGQQDNRERSDRAGECLTRVLELFERMGAAREARLEDINGVSHLAHLVSINLCLQNFGQHAAMQVAHVAAIGRGMIIRMQFGQFGEIRTGTDLAYDTPGFFAACVPFGFGRRGIDSQQDHP